MHDDINTKRTELANNLAAAGAALLDFTGTAAALAAIPNTDPQQYAAAGTPEDIAKILPATICPQRRQKHGERPTEPLQWEDSAALPADLQQLKALALAATPGIWEAQRHGVIVAGPMREYTNGSARSQIAAFGSTFHEDDADDEPDRKQANAEFCAAARPAVVLDLIARIERAAAPTDAAPEALSYVDAIQWAQDHGLNVPPVWVQRAAAPVSGDLTDAEISQLLDRARLATDAHCDGLPQEPSKEYSDAYFFRAIHRAAVSASPSSFTEPLMADGKTRLSDYLKGAMPEDAQMDDWTRGYEECRRRLFKVVGGQLRAAPVAYQAAPVVGDKIATWQERRNADRALLSSAGVQDRGLPLGRYMETEIAELRAAVAAAKVLNGELPPLPFQDPERAVAENWTMTVRDVLKYGALCRATAAPVEQGQGAAPSEKAAAANAGGPTDDKAAEIMVAMREHMLAWGQAMDDAKPEGHVRLDIEDDEEVGFPAFAGECMRFLAPRLAEATRAAPVGAGVVPEGWPTPEMLKAGRIADEAGCELEGIFKDMLRAAPTAATAHPVAADDQVLKKVEDALIMAWSYVNDGGGPVADIDEACAEIRALKRTTANGGAQGEQA